MTTQKQISRVIWAIGDLVRNEAKPGEWVPLVLMLLLLKKLSDEIGDLHENASWPQTVPSAGIQLPKEAHWIAIITSELPVTKAFNHALELLAAENTHRQNFFSSFTVPNSDVVEQITARLSQLDLSPDALEDPYAVGDAVREMLQQTAKVQRKYSGEFHTPRSVLKLMAVLVNLQPGMSLADIMCGYTGALVESARHGREQIPHKNQESTSPFSLYGQEIDPEPWRIGYLNLFLNSFDDFEIKLGDTLAEPKLTENQRLMCFDRVVCVPPFGMRYRKMKQLEHDPLRFKYGMPRNSTAELLAVEHALATLKPDGRAVFLLAAGVAFRGGRDQSVRAAMLQDNVVEAVVELPANLFFGTSIPTMIWILNPSKTDDGVLVVRASGVDDTSSFRKMLDEAQIEMIADCCRTRETREGFSRIVPLAELEEQDFNLTPSRYIDTYEAPEEIDIRAARDELAAMREERTQLTGRLNELFDQFAD